MDEQKREFYRVEFPASERPIFKTPHGDFEVVNLSERALRFSSDPGHAFCVGFRIGGRVEFHDGTQVEVDGGVVRSDSTDDGVRTVLLFARGIATDLIIRAQQRIIRMYPGFTGD